MDSTQPALLLYNNQFHLQSYLHRQGKSGHMPLQPDLLLWIRILR